MEIALLYLGITVIKENSNSLSLHGKKRIALQMSLPMPTGLKEAFWEAIGTVLENRAFYLVLIWHSS